MEQIAAVATGLPVFVLTGPTGSGKSRWAAELAEHAPMEIVSVDSALVYRGLDIGSAKPDRAIRERVMHHLIDICDPAEAYTAGRFVTDALESIRQAHARRRVPLLVGGTMLYFRALLEGLAPLPEATPQLRRQIDQRATHEGWPVLHAELARLDPEAAARIGVRDSQRIQRALEVCYATGGRISQLQRNTVSPLAGIRVRSWALAPTDRTMLHERVELRFHEMMRAGFLNEVRSLRARGDLASTHSSMRAVGYRQLWAHLDGEYALDEAVRRAIYATRQLAKRQLTWMRSARGLEGVDPDQPGAQASWNRDVRFELRDLGL
jgi:tRNA dimethylallyltransferase